MIRKNVWVLAAVAALPSVALAAGENNVGSCGWGSKVFEGQRGIAPQVLAATTNGTFGNQTFGVTSGTSGCTQDGAVTSTWRTAMFIDGNRERLARDMSMGGGETLDSLAHLMGVSEAHRAAFYRITREQLTRIFPAQDTPTEQVIATLREVLAADQELKHYALAI